MCGTCRHLSLGNPYEPCCLGTLLSHLASAYSYRGPWEACAGLNAEVGLIGHCFVCCAVVTFLDS